MRRLERLFAIVLLLQHRKRVKALEIAERFDVTERTVYRDITALTEGGVPVVSVPGVGYELSDGYYLPPLVFTPPEATALLLALEMFQAHTTGEVLLDAKRSAEKISVALPTATRERAKALARILEFYVPPQRFDLSEPHLQQLSFAIQQQRVVLFSYRGEHDTKLVKRSLEPSKLTYDRGAWYLRGYCRLRQANRAFRLSRMTALQVTDEYFSPRAVPRAPRLTVQARICFAASIVPFVLEHQHYSFKQMKTVKDAVIMTYHIESLSELLPWLLSWGAKATPLEPQALLDAIKAELDAMQTQLT